MFLMIVVVIEIDLLFLVIWKCMFFGFIKIIVDNKKGFFLFGEIYDVLFKLLKFDEENGIGDV